MENRRGERLGRRADGIALAIAALRKEHRAAILAHGVGSESWDVGRVDSGDGSVKMKVVQFRAIPRGVGAVLLRNGGEDGLVKRIAIREAELLERLAACYEFQRERAHVLWKNVFFQKRLEIDRLGAARNALMIQTCERGGDEAVAGERAVRRAGDGARILPAAGDVHKADAGGHGAARTVERFGHAGAGDAADMALAGERTLGIAFADACAGQAGHAADVGAGRALHGAVVFTGCDEAEIHPAADAAHVRPLAGDRAGVDAVLEHRTVGVLALIAAVEIGRDIVLGVERVLERHRTGHAAGVDVAGDGGFVPAGGELAERDLVDVDCGCVGNGVFHAGLRVVDGVEQRRGNFMELFVDGLDVVRDGADRAGDGVVQKVDLARNAVDGGGEAAEIGRGDKSRRGICPAHGIQAAGGRAGMIDVELAGIDGHGAGAGRDVEGDAAVILRRDVDASALAGRDGGRGVAGRGGGGGAGGCAAGDIAGAGDVCLAVDIDADAARLFDGGVDIAGERVQPGGDAARAALRVGCGLVDEVAQLVQLGLELFRGLVIELHLDVRLDLTGHAADVLAAIDRAGVDAVDKLAARAAHDAAGVVADVRITDGGGIACGGDRPRVVARDAAGVGGDVGGGQLGELREVEREGEVEIGEVNARIDALDVDVGRVFAVLDHAKVAAHESAGAVLTVDGAARAAAAEHAAGLVFADEAAVGPAAGDRAGEGAVFDCAIVLADETAGRDGVARRGDAALNVQIFHAARGLERADQARRGERVRDGKAADRVALTVERAAERGDGGEGQSCEVEIGLKHDVFLPRPGVERAARREGDQIVLGGNGDDLHLGLFSLRGGGFRGFGGFGVRCFVLRRAEDGQDRKAHERERREQRRKQAAERVILFHHRPPPHHLLNRIPD